MKILSIVNLIINEHNQSHLKFTHPRHFFGLNLLPLPISIMVNFNNYAQSFRCKTLTDQ